MNAPSMIPATAVVATGKIQLVVLGSPSGKEHTLGYLDPQFPLLAGVLRASVLKGSPAAGYGCPVWSMRRDGLTCRPATEKDFDEYRVSFESVRNNPEYEYQAAAVVA
ncbi:hypothetical protein [Hymenobacter sp. YC55]|uniref:hypothetical protein n=1 Tax=Hymenobacter sp. YC55 TaxID=3034019 RepID=UPI0023F6BE0D|nr:hypothetical protein [Hymenobacter sp. YC55]MDF7815284.1 hypothetical protein [Hymenobacter sp. YC55]